MRRVLMVAFHFPPLSVSSGIQRTLRFVQHLPEFGWEPIVLTAHPRAYPVTSDDLVKEIPAGTVVERAFALDTSNHLSLLRRYPAFLARPDRWVSWWPGGVAAGRRLITRYRPDAIWSTYPIATAHLIGRSLHRASGLPWIADFRDPMAQEGYPADPKTWEMFRQIEESALKESAAAVFVTPGAARTYRQRYPDAPAEAITVIENGYDEESFSTVEPKAPEPRKNATPVTLLHSGVIYPSERDPTQFLSALRLLLDRDTLKPNEILVRLRASGHDAHLQSLIERFRLQSIVELAPPIPYRHALNEMLHVDGLLILQASNCNDQIPAKVYEYLRAGRPILGLTDPSGDTAALLKRAGVNHVAPLDSAAEIAEGVQQFLAAIRSGTEPGPDLNFVRSASRHQRTAELARLLDAVTAGGAKTQLEKANATTGVN